MKDVEQKKIIWNYFKNDFLEALNEKKEVSLNRTYGEFQELLVVLNKYKTIKVFKTKFEVREKMIEKFVQIQEIFDFILEIKHNFRKQSLCENFKQIIEWIEKNKNWIFEIEKPFLDFRIMQSIGGTPSKENDAILKLKFILAKKGLIKNLEIN